MFALLAMKESDFKKLITLEPLDTGQPHLAAQPQPPHPAATFVARCSTLLSYMQPSATCVLPCGSLYNLLPPIYILLLPAYTPLRCLHAPLFSLYALLLFLHLGRAAQVERAAQLTGRGVLGHSKCGGSSWLPGRQACRRPWKYMYVSPRPADR